MAKKRNIIVGQSGGPTSVINSSLAGVYKNAIERGFDKVYGMLHGIQGLLDEQYVDLSTQIHTELDIDEAFMVGGAAVKAADEGDTGKMVVIDRVSDDPYMSATGIYDVHRIANEEKLVPRNWMNRDATYVTKDFIDYVKPLIQGDYQPIMVNGLPRHLVLRLKKGNKRG